MKDGYQLVKCRNCTLIYTDPMPSRETIQDYYTAYWVNQKNIVRGEQKVKRLKSVLKPLIKTVPRNGAFLDIGCNTGFACEAARLLGLRATGIDVSDDAVQKAKEIYPDNHFQTATIQELADRQQSFDFVLCREVVEHLPEIHSFFQALQTLVTIGGLAYITTPDAGHFRVPRDFVSWGEVMPPEHILFFSRDTLSQALHQHGFEVVFIRRKLKPSLRVLARRVR